MQYNRLLIGSDVAGRRLPEPGDGHDAGRRGRQARQLQSAQTTSSQTIHSYVTQFLLIVTFFYLILI